MVIQRKTDKLAKDYVKSIYAAIIDAGFPFKSGHWFHKDATLDEIIVWNQAKLEAGFQLGDTEHVRNDYMQIMFHAEQYEQMRGFWMYNENEIQFVLIVPESDIFAPNCDVFMPMDASPNREDIIQENKIAAIRELAIKIWNSGLADIIQSNLESSGSRSIDAVMNGKSLSIEPFAIIPKGIKNKFSDNFFLGKNVAAIGNDGLLITAPVKGYMYEG
jgi:hypothetical protein